MVDTQANRRLRHSVVRLLTAKKAPSNYQPWEYAYQESSGGSASVVDGNRLLTSAHVIANAVHIQAVRPGDSKKYRARVEWVTHDSELALLSVDDVQFFEGVEPVKIGGLPERQSTVSVWGYPSSGSELCITTGVVSRIEALEYTHSRRSLLAMQTDAAVNPGNSGGPVVMNGTLVGVAFQSHRQTDYQRTHYIVPVPIIRQFFEDLNDGEVSGIPDLGIHWQKIENESLREFAGLSANETGVLVTRVIHGSSAYGLLQEGDVVSKIDNVPIAGDGSVLLRDEHRVNFSHLISIRQVGDRIEVEIVRDGARRDVTISLGKYVSLIRPPNYDAQPTYYVIGGLVFQPLTHGYMSTWEWEKVDYRYKYFYYEVSPSPERREVVILSQVLAHDVNAGYHRVHGVIVHSVNGVKIRDMRDLVNSLTHPVGRHHVIEIENAGHRVADYYPAVGSKIVIDAAAASLATDEILRQHGIPHRCSHDLDDMG
jgi:S1-C subfamily serine protease